MSSVVFSPTVDGDVASLLPGSKEAGGDSTFAPLGPWIVPKEFYGDPMQKLRQTLSVGGTTLQEARAGDMIHTLWELIEYATSIITLYPGDVVNNGTSGGTAAGSAATRQLHVFDRSHARRRRLTHFDRLLWVWFSRVWCHCRTAPVIVKPETIIA